MKKQYNKIIIFNPFGIGDVIFSTPIIKALKKEMPGSRILYICNKRVKHILENNRYIDDIIIFEKDDFRDIAKYSKIKFVMKLINTLARVRAIRADLVIDLSLNHQASLIMKLLGVPERIGFNYRNRGKFLTNKIELEGFNEKHVVLYYLDILALIGITPEDKSPEIFTSLANDEWIRGLIDQFSLRDKFVVGVIPGSGRSWGENARYRRWPAVNFAHVADKLIEDLKASVVLFGDNSESGICAEVASRMKNRVINMGGKTNVGQFMSFVKNCDFVLCNEGGPLHICVALDVPSISIFGPVDENVYGPFSDTIDKHEVVTDNIECRPCYSKFKLKKCKPLECLNNISEKKVFDAIQLLVERTKKSDRNTVRT